MSKHTRISPPPLHSNRTQDDKPFIPPKTPWTDWIPLLVVLAYTAGLSIITTRLTSYSVVNLLSYSMGYFFVVFSLFKLIDLRGFAMGYNKYDLISQRWYAWGYIAPFIEMILGSFYILRVDSYELHTITFIYSLIIVIGVWKKLAKREIFTCACLGTVLKVPLTKVSLIEYLIMALMAGYMILAPGA